jgi:hypothetical protein
MSAVFNHAMRHEWLEKNPISLVRQSAKRESIPAVLDAAEISALLTELPFPYKQMVLLAATTGLRVSELLGLKCDDINFDSREIHLSHGVVHRVIGYPACGQTLWHQEAHWLAHLSAQLCEASQIKWRRREGGSGGSAACQQPNYAGYVHTGTNTRETRSTNQSCQDDLAGADSDCCGRRKEVILFIVPFCSHAGKPNFPQVLARNGGDDGTRTRGLCRDRAAF